MKLPRAAIAAFAMICVAAQAQTDDASRPSERPVRDAHDHLDNHAGHEHGQPGEQPNALNGHAADVHGAANAKSPQHGHIFWLGLYCVVIIGASLLGGWLPQWLDLSHNRMQVAISLIGGLMLGIGVFHMLPHALVELGEDGPDLAAHGMMAGLVVMFLLLRAFHFHHHGTLDSLHHEHESVGSHDHGHEAGHDHDHGPQHLPVAGLGPKNLSWMGVFLGMAFHSIGDGLALGASIEADVLHGATMWMGLGTFLAVALHKPVDAISITTLMAAGGWSSRSRTIVNAGFSLICPVGALLFVLGVHEFSDRQSTIVGLALAVSAGVFICIALGDLLPEMEFHSHNRVRLTLALLTGVALAWAIRLIEPPHAHSHGAGHSARHAHE